MTLDNNDILAHIQAIYQHWVEVCTCKKEINTIAASNLTLATIIAAQQQVPPSRTVAPAHPQAAPVELTLSPAIKINGVPYAPAAAGWDLSNWTPLIETKVVPAEESA